MINYKSLDNSIQNKQFCVLELIIQIYNFGVWQMEVQYDFLSYQRLIRYLVFSQNVFTITTFLNFIEPQQVKAIAQLSLDRKRTQKFYRIAVAKLFTDSYFNRVDRGIFFLFYDQPQFQNIEKNTINALAYRNYEFLEKAYHSFQSILSQLSKRTSYLQTSQQLKSILQNIFFEPDMPMPKMKRQTIGMYCETAFQQFLSLKRFEEEDIIGEEWLEQALQQLKQQLQNEVALGIASNQPIVEHLMETVRYKGWLVNCETWRQHLIDQFHTHNLLVILLAMSSQLIQTVNVLLQTIEDPLMRFVQFNLRSSIFRNIVLTIEVELCLYQDRLGFAITAYDKIYQNKMHPTHQRPPFSFWRAALSMWGQRMGRYHEENKKVYDYITGKLRENSLLEYLAPKTEMLPSVYSELRGKAELNGFSEVLKNQAYLEIGGGSELEGFFQANHQLYEVLAKDYLQYSVDLSINQINVHWCGHSQHTISHSPIYRQIMNGFVQSSVRYYQHLKSLIEDCIPGDLRILTFREIVKEDLQFVGLKQAKPNTVRVLLQKANKMIGEMVQQFVQFAVFGEEAIAKYRIYIDFQEKDNLLVYFAGKAEIPMDCSNVMRFFYDIQLDPLKEIPKLDMLELDGQSCGEDHEVYESQNEEDENEADKNN